MDEYVEGLGRPQGPPDESFLDFARRMTRHLFREGWDRTYQDACLTSSLPLTSCSEAGRKDGGCRGWSAEERMNRAEFCEYVLKAVVPKQRGVSRVQAIETGGKWRIVSIPPRVDNCLRPLHKAMYSHLSRFSWCLRGDAKANRFKDFSPVEGEVFVSGDYESATDNLNSDLQVAIMEELLNRASTVPRGIAEHAIQTYRSALVYGSGPGRRTVVQARGQLMGQLTSFPMLCLVNYITFRYSIRRPVPVRINGDDIVFRATPDEFARWERNVAKGGLKLSVGKTMVHSRAFTLNSTPFWACASGARLVGFIRPKALFPQGSQSDRLVSLNGRFYSACAGFGGSRKSVVRRAFVLLNQNSIHLGRRSLTRGYGLAVDRGMLHDVGMWHRELFYLEQVDEPRLPLLDKGGLPKGWAQIPRSWFASRDEIDDWERQWMAECVWHAWFGQFQPSDFSEDNYLASVREGCLPYGLGSLGSARVRRMLGLTRRAMWDWVNRRRNESVFGLVRRDRGKGVWVSVDRLPPRAPVVFVKSMWTT